MMESLAATVQLVPNKGEGYRLRVDFFGSVCRGPAQPQTGIIATHGAQCPTFKGALAAQDQARAALDTLGVPVYEKAPV